MKRRVKQNRSGCIMTLPKRAFTLIELLVAIALIAILVALIFPVFAQVRDKGRQAACLSNTRQLAVACNLYLNDYDESYPLLWWAGATYPYVKNTGVYRCPDNGNSVVIDKGATAYPLSYECNSNRLGDPMPAMAAITSPAQTVLLFEVTGINVQLLDPTEGVRSDEIGPQQFSGGGDGLDCRLLTTGPTTINKGGSYPNAQYATGLLDNSTPVNDQCYSTQFTDRNGRHSDGSNFVAADGHAKWLRGIQVSAGETAPFPNSDQTRSGCISKDIAAQPTEPCAAGSANGKHVLTFSIK